MPPKGYQDYLPSEDKKGGTAWAEGNGLLSALNLPQGLYSDSPFTWKVNTAATVNPYTGGKVTGPIAGPFMPDQNPNVSTRTQMTVAGAMSWLRQLAVNNTSNGGQFDAIVHQLVAAGYLTPDQARYGSYTTSVGNAFLKSVADVWSINNSSDQGQLMTWGDHMQAIIDGRKASGQIDPNTELPTSGSGGSAGPQGPTRTDTYTNPDDVKKAINDAAENVLGRRLTDSEVGQFQSVFHGMESHYNDQVWAQQMAAFNNQSSDPNTAPALTQAPSASGEAADYMSDSPAFGQERTTQQLGSYLGVLRSMVGMGGGGVSNAVS